MSVHKLDQLIEIAGGPGEAVNLVSDDEVMVSGLDVPEQLLKRGPLDVGPRVSGIGVNLGDLETLLAGDEGSDAGFLGLAGVEFFLGLLIGGDTSVDGATGGFRRHVYRRRSLHDEPPGVMILNNDTYAMYISIS
jgi:hypothetical protein